MKSRSTAILIALFLGGLGIHKFYLGRPVAGVLMAVFFWTFVPVLIALVNILELLFMSEERFNKIYN